MKKVYFDNGATSYPKAPNVADAIADYITNNGSSTNRGAYSDAFEVENIVFETREMLASFFGYNKPKNVIFTKNITESLNVLLHGYLKSGDHVIVSSLEHNAVMRPLMEMSENNITFTRVNPEKSGNFYEDDLTLALEHNTKLIVMTYASNVSGIVLNLKQVGEFAKKHNIRFVIDSAQAAGFIDMDINDLNADAIAFTGHKSLLGPQGIGGFVIKSDFAKEVKSLVQGGTGSKSDSEIQPKYLPDKYEAGTPNIVGIVGLNASIKYIQSVGLSNIRKHELFLLDTLVKGLKQISGINVIGGEFISNSTPVVSIDIPDVDTAMVSHELASKYNISNRCGMHCAPSAHKYYGTFPQGTIRFSVGYSNTIEEVEYVLNSLKQIIDDIE